jgi:hypothetical protein
VRESSPKGVVIDDPGGLLKWLAKDRAMMVFENLEDFSARRTAFQRIVKQWIAHV